MDLGAIRLFVEVARQGGFSPVARSENVEPSSVSRAVATLETELGTRLFQRSTRKLSLTEAGAAYLERVTPALEAFEAAREEVTGSQASGPSGTLRLAASVAFGQALLAPLLPEFRARYPNLKIDLVLSDTNADLITDRIDLAIRLAPSVSVDVIGARLIRTRYRVCASPSFLQDHRKPDQPADLAALRCLRLSLPGYRDAWQFRDESGSIITVPVDGDVTTSSVLVLKTCALSGLGPALLPDWLVRDALAEGTLVDCFPTLQAAATDFETSAWLLYPSRAFLPAKVRAAIDLLRERLRN